VEAIESKFMMVCEHRTTQATLSWGVLYAAKRRSSACADGHGCS
jgi:hypothetical protein